MSGNRLGSGCTVRIVAGGRPKLFCRHHSDGGDLNQEFARLRLGNRTYYRLQVPFVRKLHCFHLCHCFTPWLCRDRSSKWFPTFTLFSVVMRPDVTSCVPNVASSCLCPPIRRLCNEYGRANIRSRFRP